MLNRSLLVGRLTKDVELKYTPNGVAVATFTLAVNRPFTNQNNERESDFIRIVSWRKIAENAANFIGKGSLVAIDGRIQTRSFDGDNGNRVYLTEVVADSIQYLESKDKNSGGNSGSRQSQNDNADPFRDKGEPIDINDDDLPF